MAWRSAWAPSKLTGPAACTADDARGEGRGEWGIILALPQRKRARRVSWRGTEEARGEGLRACGAAVAAASGACCSGLPPGAPRGAAAAPPGGPAPAAAAALTPAVGAETRSCRKASPNPSAPRKGRPRRPHSGVDGRKGSGSTWTPPALPRCPAGASAPAAAPASLGFARFRSAFLRRRAGAEVDTKTQTCHRVEAQQALFCAEETTAWSQPGRHGRSQTSVHACSAAAGAAPVCMAAGEA